MKRTPKTPGSRRKFGALVLAQYAGGTLLLYAVIGLVLLFMLENQPASFIYVSF